MRNKFEVAGIISRFKEDFIARYHPCGRVIKVLSLLEQCRTSALGGHRDACPDTYSCLFSAAWQTLKEFAQNKGLQPGMIAILHTWGSNLHYHPHLHCIVPCGGIDKNGIWKNISGAKQKSPFLFSVQAMSPMFRAKFMSMLDKKVSVPQSMRKRLFAKKWVIYSKAAIVGTEKVIEYLGRYSHRVAISNNRIKEVTDTSVTFDYKDYRQGGKHKLTTLTGQEFLHRFSQHILPAGFVRIRHYGFLPGCNREKLRNIQKQMNVPCSPVKREKKKWKEVCVDKWEQYNLCPHCKACQMVTIEVFGPTRPPPFKTGIKSRSDIFHI